MITMGSRGRRIGWSITALVLVAGLGLAGWRYSGRLKREVTLWIRPDSGRLALAEAAYRQRDWQRALDLARPLLKAKVDDPEVRRIYARAAARLQRDGAAAALYQNLSHSTVFEPEDYLLMGLLQVRSGKPEAALEVWEQGARQRPDHAELLEHLTKLSIRMERLDEAATAARALSRQRGREARGWLLLGDIENLLENPDGAAAAIREGLEHDPEAKGMPFAPDHYRRVLARNLLKIGRAAEARAPLEAVLAGTGPPGGDPEASWLLSRACLQEGRIAEAARAVAQSGPYRTRDPLVPEPSPYVGTAGCAPCHSKESRAHERTRHARTFHHGPGLLELPLPGRPLADPERAKVTHTFSRDDGEIHVKTRAGNRVHELVVEYAFGTRDRCVTMVGRDDERTFRAARLSSYHTAAGVAWKGTFGDGAESSAGDDVRGHSIQVRDGLIRCLYCHVTQPREFGDRLPEQGASPQTGDPGIGCERCHGPGGNHLAALKAGFPDSAIVNAGNASAAAIVAQCADCHTVGPANEIKNAPDDPRFVRSSGLTLTFSRCYTDSDGGMSCVTCHDPHRDDERTAGSYDAKCLACHVPRSAPKTEIARGSAKPAPPSSRRAALCPVNPTKDCVRCHMPKVPVPSLQTSLTDHYIRVHKS
jgi:tetratricopeptide (TPR) repeat protein